MSDPLFIHDCPRCQFLTHHHGHDLYVCAPGAGSVPEVVARYGSDPQESFFAPANVSALLDVATGIALSRELIRFGPLGVIEAAESLLPPPPVDELAHILGPNVEAPDTVTPLAQLEKEYQDRADAIVPVAAVEVLDEELRLADETPADKAD